MSKKRALTTAAVVLALAGLIYLQIRTWRKFEWGKFASATEGGNYFLIGAGIAPIFLSFYLQAGPWNVLLPPVCPPPSLPPLAPTRHGLPPPPLLPHPP